MHPLHSRHLFFIIIDCYCCYCNLFIYLFFELVVLLYIFIVLLYIFIELIVLLYIFIELIVLL